MTDRIYPFKAWSYSALTSFETCPRRHYLTRVAKIVKEPDSEHLRWGNFVHEALDKRVQHHTPLPETIQRYETFVLALEKREGVLESEQKIALTKDFEQVGYFDRNVWLRAVLDVSLTSPDGKKALVLDWKTGKNIPDDDQLKLFAAVSFSLSTALERVHAGYAMLQLNKMTPPVVFHREQESDLWNEFMPRVQRLQRAHEKNQWPEKPSGLCKKYCPVGKQNCDYCGW